MSFSSNRSSMHSFVEPATNLIYTGDLALCADSPSSLKCVAIVVWTWMPFSLDKLGVPDSIGMGPLTRESSESCGVCLVLLGDITLAVCPFRASVVWRWPDVSS